MAQIITIDLTSVPGFLARTNKILSVWDHLDGPPIIDIYYSYKFNRELHWLYTKPQHLMKCDFITIQYEQHEILNMKI